MVSFWKNRIGQLSGFSSPNDVSVVAAPADPAVLILITLILVALMLIIFTLFIWRMHRELVSFRRLLERLLDRRYAQDEPAKPDPDLVRSDSAINNDNRLQTETTTEAKAAVEKEPGPKPSHDNDLSSHSVDSSSPIKAPEDTDQPSPVKGWIYPIELEEQLLDAVRNGEKERALGLLDTIEGKLPPLPEKYILLLHCNIAMNLRQLMYDFNESDLDPSIADPDLAQQLAQGNRGERTKIIRLFIERLSGAFYKRTRLDKSEIVLQARTFIEANYQTGLTVNAIAAALFISAPYLYRLMREEVGISPAHYLTNLRIRHATRLLRNSDKPIAQVANDAGFETEQCFFRQFKKQMDCTPNQYRNRYSLS
jgi:AraC-like DNA-binding protein